MSEGKLGMRIGESVFCIVYLPVTLYAKSHPRVGILTLPKTVTYMIMICMGLSMLPG